MRIGMVSTRFAGLDGVSLETAKVAEALERVGHEVVWFAGRLGPEFTPGVEDPAAFFGTVENLELEQSFFHGGDPAIVESVIEATARRLIESLDGFVSSLRPSVLVVQNDSAAM